MNLSTIAGSNKSYPFLEFMSDGALVRELQRELSRIGLLDPPADGTFGPVTEWALGNFAKRQGIALEDELSADVAERLLNATPLPLTPGTDLSGKIAAGMLKNKHWIARDPDCLTIAYVEGLDPDGSPNDNAPNKFNDLRTLIRLREDGVTTLVASWIATTEPGRYWTEHPQNSKGAARIAFGQYKSWVVGTHHPNKPSRHEALVQAADVTVYRDKNKDYKREGDKRDTGLFGINQHWGYDEPQDQIRRSSAGCLVGRAKKGHREFMASVKQDPRYKANRAYKFMTAILPASDVVPK